MDRKSIINQLELAYSPLTNYEFAIVKDDPIIDRALEKASLYVIAQRHVLSFENIIPNESEPVLEFEIHQRNNPNILKCRLPFLQDVFEASGEHEIGIAINYIDKQKTHDEVPLGGVHGISFVEFRETEERFLIWFSPEKLLQNYWREDIECEIEGDIREFLKYNVHYVGKATKQSILKRLTGHNTLQDIISLEHPFTYNDLPTHEIAILCFEFQDNLEIQTFGDNSDVKDMMAALTGENRPEQEKIFLDAEKALIKAMQPGYNKEMFNNYPVSKDGLYDEKYDAISYTFMDPITLIYEQGEIEGGTTPIGGDAIIVLDNETMKIIKD
jgi:hypothetical protein